MRKRTTRLVSMMLTLVLLVSSVSPAAMAAGEVEIFPDNSVAPSAGGGDLSVQLADGDVAPDDTGGPEFVDGDVSPARVDESVIGASPTETFPVDSQTAARPGDDGLGAGSGEEVIPPQSDSGPLSMLEGDLSLSDDEDMAIMGESSEQMAGGEDPALSGMDDVPQQSVPAPVPDESAPLPSAAPEEPASSAVPEEPAPGADAEAAEPAAALMDGPGADPAPAEPGQPAEPQPDAEPSQPAEPAPDMIPSEVPAQAPEDGEPAQDDDMAELYAASIRLSSSYVTLAPGGSKQVSITISGYSGSVYLQYGRSRTNYTCSWGRWSGNTIPLTIKGSSGGSGYVYVYLKNSRTNSTLASTRISVNVVASTPKLTAACSSVNVKKGYTTNVTFTCSGFSGMIYLRYGSTNTSAYSCTWGSWGGNSIPLKIKGLKAGSGTVTVYMYSTTGSLLASKSISVRVTEPENPRLTLSRASVYTAAGTSTTITASYSGYSGSVYMQYSSTNTSAYSCSWGGWSGNSVPLTIRANRAGSGTVRVYLKSVSGSTLASATISVTVYQRANPKVTVSPSSLSVRTGSSAAVTCTVSGVSESYYLQYSSNNTNAYSCSWGRWSGSSIKLTVTGRNAGSGSITIRLKNYSGSTLATATISPVQVTAQPQQQPSLRASTSQLSVDVNSTKSVNITYANCNVAAYLQYSVSSTSIMSCSWGSWSGSTIPLKVTGKSEGTGRVNVYLKNKSTDATLASTSFTVNVNGGGGGGGGGDSGDWDVSYSFSNYSKSISYDICKYMYGDTQLARTVYLRDIGTGGVCYGMSTTAGLLSVSSESPTVGSFSGGRTRMNQLKKTDNNSSMGLTLSGFIEAMHITQLSWAAPRRSGLSNLVSAVKSGTSSHRPVVVLVTGPGGGHAILAYGYTETSSQVRLKISDSNYPEQERTLTIGKSGSSYTSWAYDISNSMHWNNSNGTINYMTYADYHNVWNQRGSLQSADLFGEDEPTYNLLCTEEKTFYVYNMDKDAQAGASQRKLVAQYVNGVFTSFDPEITDIPAFNVMPDGSLGKQIFTLSLPVRYYIIEDGTPDDGMKVTLTNKYLSTTVESQAKIIKLCASDKDNLVSAMVNPEVGEPYSISIGTSGESQAPEVYEYEGKGDGGSIGAAMEPDEDGNLSLSLTGGGDDVSLSVSAMDANPCDIVVLESAGGTIAPVADDPVKQGGSYVYNITPDEGWVLQDVIVNGESVGPQATYTFEKIQASSTIEAKFARNLSECAVTLSAGTFDYDGTAKCPVPTVKDGETTLQEGVDYEVIYCDNTEPGDAQCVITALTGGNYTGMKETVFAIHGTTGILDADIQDDGKVSMQLDAAYTGVVVCAIYDEQGKLLRVETKEIPAGTTACEFAGLVDSEAFRVKAYMLDSAEDTSPVCPAVHKIAHPDG